MKLTKLNNGILLIIFFISIKAFCYADSPFEITTLDNPAPGYLRFTWSGNQDFFLVDNSGKMIYDTSTINSSYYITPLKDGNWAQIVTNKYYIYNQQMQLIDSIPNPTIDFENPFDIDWHSIVKLSNGHYLLLMSESVIKDMSQIVELGKDNATVLANVLIETDRTGQIFWQWKAMDHLNILDVTSDVDLTQMIVDMSHINSMLEDTDGNIIISIRHYDEIAKINKSNGNFIWQLGGSKCKNNEFTFPNDYQNGFTGFSHQHSISLSSNNDILLYDNGNMKEPASSRAVEYHLNFAEMTATKIWEYRPSPELFQGAMGSVQRLLNGNTLINWGKDYITEVTPNNKVVFNLAYNNNQMGGVYSANRIITRMDAVIQNINSTGNYNFNNESYNTGININISNLIGSGITSIEKHYYLPSSANFTDSTFTQILPYRWVFNTQGITNINGTIYIQTSSLQGLNNPGKVTIYQRDKEGEGFFQELSTIYNSQTGELSANFSGGGEFVLGSNILNVPPTLLYPENNTVRPTNGNTKWSYVQGAKKYQIQFDSSATFSNPKINLILNKTFTYSYDSLLNSTYYSWRVRALNNKDTSGWSNVFNFTTYLSKPKLSTPTNNKFGFGLTELLSWEKVLLATKYSIQLSSSQLFSNIIFTKENIQDNFISIPNLSYNTQYYWRVKASNNNNSSDWSAPFSFRTVLENPKLKFPQNDTINIPITCSLIWNETNGVNNYRIQVSKDQTFQNNLIENSFSETNSFKVENLENNNKYFWRVKAVRITDSSDWSPIWDFETNLQSPGLIQPQDQKTNVPTNCTLTWFEDDENATYSIQVSKNSIFTNLVIDSNNITVPALKMNILLNEIKYYWHVKKFLGKKESDWTNYWSFITEKSVQIAAPKLLSPKNNSDSYIKGKLIWLQNDNAQLYRVQIAKSNTFDELVQDTLISNFTEYSYYKFNIGFAYYWRVKAYGMNDSSSWSSVWSFNVTQKSEIVKLLSPFNENMQVPLSGFLEWEAIEGALFYHLQIAKDPDFKELIVGLNNVFNSKYQYSNLQKNETYYWRVNFVREYDTSAWSNVWSFNTLTSNVLNLPKLLSPVDGDVPVPISGELTWTSIDDASRYSLSVSTSSSFETIFLKENNIKTNVFDYTELTYNTKYFWRVAAQNDSSKSNWSDVQYFTTELESPEIKYPLNNSTKIPIQGEISWNISEDNSYYLLQISTDSEFTDLVFESGYLSQLKFDYSLDCNSSYYCRVKAIYGTNYSRWSQPVHFTTLDPNSIEQSFLRTEITNYPNPLDKSTIFDFSIEDYGKVSITIFDIFGNEISEIFSQNLTTGQYKFNWDASKIEAGVYFYKLTVKNSFKINKLIIVR